MARTSIPAPPEGTAARTNWSKIGIYAVLFAGVMIALGPFLWMISASFMTVSEVNLARLFPEELLWENYATALRRANFLKIELTTDPTSGILQSVSISGYLWNSLRITLISVTGLYSVVLPLSKAPIMTIITLGFIGSWNALMWPLLVTVNDNWRPIAVGLSNFVTSDTPGDLNLQMAASVITVIPILILYFVAQKQFTEGISQTGIRG